MVVVVVVVVVDPAISFGSVAGAMITESMRGGSLTVVAFAAETAPIPSAALAANNAVLRTNGVRSPVTTAVSSPNPGSR